MIYASFDSNLRPVTETYSGLGGAMLEACASDMAMFKAMLKLDAIEIKLNESAEGDTKEEKQSKMEKAKNMASGAWAGIKEKVAKMLEWLGDKISQAAAAVTAQFNKLWTADAEHLRKNLKKVANKEALAKMQVKYNAFEKDPFEAAAGYNPEVFSRNTKCSEVKSEFEGQFTKEKFTEVTKSGAEAFKMLYTFFSNSEHTKISKFASRAVKFRADCKKAAANIRKEDKLEGDAVTNLNENCKKYRDSVIASMRDLQNGMKKQYASYRRVLRQLEAGSVSKDEAALLEFYLQDGDMEVENMFECVITGCPVENLIAESTKITGPEIKSHEKAHAELMQSMAEPLF